MKKKGISPIIATVLLVAMVIVIGLIIFLWFKSFMQEAVTKGEENIALVCNHVDMSVRYSSNTIYITNDGDVPIWQMSVQIISGGNYKTIILNNESNSWPKNGLNPGGVMSGSLDAEGADSIILIPILIGSSDSGEKTHKCNENNGFEISL